MASGTDSRSKVPAVLAVTLFALAMAELVTAITVAVTAGMSFGDAVRGFVVTNGAMGLAFPACGVLLAWHRPRNPIGWLFLAAGIGHATSAAAAALLAPGLSSGWSPGAVRLLGTAFVFAWPWSIGVLVPVALLLFPDGRSAGRRWRWLPWAAVAEGLLFVASFATPGPQPIGRRIVSPYLTIPVHSQLAPLWAVGNVAWASIIAAAVTSLVIRYRRGGDTERRQLLWLLLAALGVLAYAGIPWGIFGTGPILGLLVVPLIPVAVTIAILRYQLLDIRLVVSRTLLYGALTAGLAGIYVGLVALLDVAVRSRVSLGSAVVASIVIAFGFGPAQVSAGPRSRRRRTLHPDQRALPIPELAGAGAIYAYSFILTSLDVSTPARAAAAEHWYHHRTTVENIFRDSKLGAALWHLPSGYPQVNQAWMWGALLAATMAAWLHQLTAVALGEDIVHGHGVRGGKAMIATLRWRLIAVPGRVIRHARHLILRLPPGHGLLPEVLARLRNLPAPAWPAPPEPRLPVLAHGPPAPTTEMPCKTANPAPATGSHRRHCSDPDHLSCLRPASNTDPRRVL